MSLQTGFIRESVAAQHFIIETELSLDPSSQINHSQLVKDWLTTERIASPIKRSEL